MQVTKQTEMFLCILMLPCSYLTETKKKQDTDNQSFYSHALLFIGKRDRCVLLQFYVYWYRDRALNLRYFFFLISHIHKKRRRVATKNIYVTARKKIICFARMYRNFWFFISLLGFWAVLLCWRGNSLDYMTHLKAFRVLESNI